MVQVYIYKLSATPLVRGIAKLLETIIQKNFRVHVLCENKSEMYELDNNLWTYSALAFLPHATEEDTFLDQQKILLTTQINNLNNANVLLANYVVPELINNYERFVSIYDASTDETLIREQIKNLTALNIPITIFEEERGAWKRVN
ncbi:MAG: DNA polymerase III subunit chi [Candidatus Midichloria sp.]|nr:MAG: DNA polymerase III subunit chi [Candidatus Midichloria sp.]